MIDSNLKKIRLEKLEKLKGLGVNPYPASYNKTHSVAQARESLGKEVSTAGRIFSFRTHGNIAFADIKDETGKIQLFLQKKLLGGAYKNLSLLDIGDFIGVKGKVVKTVAGEISIAPTSYTLLSKSLLPLPNEWFGLKDTEIKYRQRYLDLILNPELREMFRKKNLFWQTIREYLIKDGGLEVETPVLVNTTGGADARPFITHHFAFDMDVYLRISPELYLKRLLVAGFEKVFEIGRIFRNEGVSDEHLQDYTQMEMYWAYKDYEWLMDFVEKMTQEIIKKVFGTLKTKWKEHVIDWSGKWPRVEFMKLLSEKWHVDVEKLSVKELYGLAEKLKIKTEPNLGKGRILDHLYKKTIRPSLIQPMYIINHPVEVEPLAKRLESNSNNVQRMQILAMGSELGKGFSELNDPLDQYERFREQQALRDAGDEEAQMMDEDFVEALEYGMPPAAGFAYSERFFAMLMDSSVRELQFFPLMKPEESAKKLKQDFEKKIVIVINKDLEDWQAMNALAHMSAYIGNKIKDGLTTGENFTAKDVSFPRNSQYPIIALSGGLAEIKKLAKKVRESGLLYHAFIREMIETTNDEEIIKILSKKNEDEIEYLGIGIFGPNEEVSKLTKNFNLWKSNKKQISNSSNIPQKVAMTREEAYTLLTRHMSLKNLIKHSLSCEAAMKEIYKYLHSKDCNAESEKEWGITGLLHDIDYEMAQKENKLDKHGILIFEKDPNIIPEPIAHAIKSHNFQNTKVEPISDMDWAITCVDQLTGIIVASALIHPDKKLSSIDAKFVLKRFNTPSFAKGASREVIKMCEEKLGIPLEKFIEITLSSMQKISKELGL